MTLVEKTEELVASLQNPFVEYTFLADVIFGVVIPKEWT